MTANIAPAPTGIVPIKLHIQAVDGLRGLAIALVLLFHFWQQTWSRLHIGLPGLDWTLNLNVLAETGFIGVQLFFVLSGFCIAWPYAGGRPLLRREFLRRRAAKILPSYWLCLIVIAIWFVPPHLQQSWPRHLAMNLLFLQTWQPEYLYWSLNAVLWSLAVEIHFYLLFAAIGGWWLRHATWVMFGSLAVWALVGVWALTRPPELFDLYRHQLWPHLPFFAIGVSIAVYQRSASRVRGPFAWGLAGAVLWIGTAWLIWMPRHAPPLLAGTHWPTALEYLYIPLLAAGFGMSLFAALQPGFWSRLWSLRWLGGLGLISYNLYLWHQFLIVRLKLANVPPLRDVPFGEDRQWQLATWVTAVTLAIGISWLLTRYFEEPLRQRLTAGPSLGAALRALLLAPARWRGPHSLTAAVTALLRLLPTVPTATASAGAEGLRAQLWRHRAPLLVLAASWGLVNAWLQIHALQFRPDGAWAGHMNIWSDWPLHIAMATMFADRPPDQWLADHPMFAHGRLIYPFGVNLVSGLLLRAGLELDWALTLPTFVAAVVSPWLLYALFVTVLGRPWRAVLAVCLFYLGSGLGGFRYLWEWIGSDAWSALAYPPVEVSRLDRYDWYSGNALTGMLLPQRAYVFGFPVALGSLLFLLRAVQPGIAHPRRWAVAGGLLAGVMPLLHTHSFMALGLIGVAVAAVYRVQWRIWSLYAGCAAALGLLLVSVLYTNGHDLPNHLRWAPGFAAVGGLWSWIVMWWQLWGLSIPVLALSAVFLRRDAALPWTLLLGGVLCFAFANLVMVQPNRWDNSKILLWSYLCWAPLWAHAIGALWQRRSATRVLAVALTAGLALTGVVEVWRLLRVDRGAYMISTTEEIRLAQRVRRETESGAVFLTESSHNHPVMAWGGRPVLLGFTGWIANLGFDYRQREADLRRMYGGGDEASRLLLEYGVDYVYVGAGERRNLPVDEDWLRRNYAVAFESPQVRIYATGPRDPGRIGWFD